MASIRDEIGAQALKRYLLECRRHVKFDLRTAFSIVQAMRRGKTPPEIAEIQRRWYESLATGDPDYSVYGAPYYFCDTWMCWIQYSRKYLLGVEAPKSGVASSTTTSILDDLGNVQTVADLGCGFGYSTALLKEMFPAAMVVGTNLPGTAQWEMCVALGQRKGFTMQGDSAGLAADLAFASEYFEHFQAPIEHLNEVIAHCSPRSFLFANTFNSPSIGHFDVYLDEGVEYSGRQISRRFNQALGSHGYHRVKTRMWNSRPDYWTRD